LDGGDVLVGGAKLLAELLGSEPFVIAGRTGRVHVADELPQSGLLRWAAPQHQVQALKRHAVGRGSAIIGGIGQRMNGSLQGHASALVDGSGDAVARERRLGGLRAERNGQERG